MTRFEIWAQLYEAHGYGALAIIRHMNRYDTALMHVLGIQWP